MENKAAQMLQNAKTAAIFIHINPDADAVGSALAVRRMLLALGAETVHCFSENKFNAKLQTLNGVDAFFAKPLQSYDLGVVVDCSEIARIGINSGKVLEKCRQSLVFDHHVGKGNFCDVEIIDSTAASTTEIIYGFLCDEFPQLIDGQMAEYLYAGAVTDTGGFVYQSVTSRTMSMVAELYKQKFNPSEVARQLIRSTQINVFNLRIKALSQARFYDNNTIGLVIFTKKLLNEVGAGEEDTENIVTDIINIDTVKVAFAMTEIGQNAYKVSIRSKLGASALACARCFGGGGHEAASGCRVYGLLEECVDSLVVSARDTREDA